MEPSYLFNFLHALLHGRILIFETVLDKGSVRKGKAIVFVFIHPVF